MVLTDLLYTDCSPSEIVFTVNGKQVDSGATFTVGDVLTCSSERALSYRWSGGYNDSDRVTYGNTVVISQPGTFSHECTAFVRCGAGAICSVSTNIIGLATDVICLRAFLSDRF